ncbi:MAG: hypothetical protein RBS07_11215 [Lentimicrobium sp.]|jgi:TANFOR domain-containing protein|nr:hypothetical protein [Lentimicrobium sp.]
MCTLSENKNSHSNCCGWFRLAILLAMFLPALTTIGQTYPVRITIAVSPPYSTRISDYTSQPNKIMATVQSMAPDQTLSVYLHGSISSEGGISVSTRPGHKPAQPILLRPGMPVMLNINNIGDIFNENNLVYEGITPEEIIYGNGLPEDQYVICLQAFDYSTNQPLSEEEPIGCSAPFGITSLEPPVILQPLCQDTIRALQPQNVLISWTRPVGAPVNLQYRLLMIEVLPSDMDINAAMNSASHPVFYETTIMANAFVYGPAQPALVAGKTYAFQVTAIDPSGKASFRNGGTSEVCSFTWKNRIIRDIDTQPNYFQEANTHLINIDGVQVVAPVQLITTTVKGKLKYKYKETGGANNYALAGATIRLVVATAEIIRDKPPIAQNVHNIFLEDTDPNPDPDIGKTLGITQTDANGNYTFSFLQNIAYGQTYNASGEMGNDRYKVAVIVIEAPHKSFYFNPTHIILPENGSVNALPDITALVRSYELDITVKPQTYGDDQTHAVGTDILSGINVYLCRKIDFSYQLYPLEDGMLKGRKHEVDPSVANKFPGFSVVAHGTTNNQGIVSFQRVVWHNNNTFKYYLVTDILETSDQYFTSTAPMWVSPPSNLPSPSGSGTINPANIEFPIFYEYYSHPHTIFLQPKYPRIFGLVTGTPDPHPVAGVSLELREVYIFNQQDEATLLFSSQGNIPVSPLIDCINNSTIGICLPPKLTFITASDGTFAFNELNLLYSRAQKSVIGPERKLKLKKTGYKEQNIDIPLLMFGKQTYRNFTLEKGAMLSGYVKDAESGQALNAYVRLIGENSIQCGAGGHYAMPVPKLPGQTQQLIVEKQGYITDTISFVAGQDHQSLNIELFALKRRLRVIVHQEGNYFLPVRNCLVQILNLTNGQSTDFTDEDGVVQMNFTNAGMNNDQVYRVRVGMFKNTDRNFETRYFNLKIPYGKNPTIINCALKPAACITGHVYAGSGSASPVGIATVRYNGSADTLTGTSDPNGYYYINNFPVRLYKQTVTASKSQSNLIGDEKKILINHASNECVTHDFNLTVYDDMDITQLMGFPMEVLKLTSTDDEVSINGNITSIPGNDQFKTDVSTVIPFNNVIIVPGALKNAKNIPIAEPKTLPVNLAISSLDNLSVLNTFNGKLYAPQALVIDRYKSGSNYGAIKGRVKVPSTEYNSPLVELPDLWLAATTGTGTSKMMLTVFVADPGIKKPLSLPASGFYVCNSNGGEFQYSFPHFPNAAYADPAKSFLNTNHLLISTTLYTNCNNTSPRNLKLKLGNVEITKSEVKLNTNSAINLQLDKWALTSSDWEMSTNGIWLKNAKIQGKMEVGIKDIEITYNAMLAHNAKAEFGTMKMLDAIPVTVTTSNKGLNYIEYGGKMQWQLYANTDGSPQTAYIAGLPGLDTQKVPIGLISMLSDNSPPKFIVKESTLKLFGLVDFMTSVGTAINVYDLSTPPYIQVQGKYMPGFKYMEEFTGNLAWEKKGQGFNFLVNNPASINFTHSNMIFEWVPSSIKLSNNLFTATGTATEPGKLGPVAIVLNHQPATTEIYIPLNEKIYITLDKSKYFDEVVGGMVLNKGINIWNNFWFEGEMVGMGGISDNAQKSRLKFVCNGAITAENASINVSNLDAFPGMSFTYDIQNSRLSGSANVDQDLMGMHANGTVECIFDPQGWYFNILGMLTIPGIGSCDLYGLIGDYQTIPPTLKAPFGALKCIPSGFQNSVSGFLLQGGLTKQLIAPIEWGVTLPLIDKFIGVNLSADVSLNARTWMSFAPQVNEYGLSLLAEGNIAGGLSGTAFNISANANAQLGISGTYYSNGNYNIIGCGSVQAGVKAEVFYGLGWTGVDITSPDIGLKMKISNSGSDFNLILGSCGDNLCP